jgi:large conductance mechanosensitive channel
MMLGGVSFTELAVTLKAATADAPAVMLKYGVFEQTVIDFILIALAVFAIIKVINMMHRKKEAAAVEAAPPAPTKEQELLTEIRDLLKK